jgi:DNA-3-methyladenine glycosylase
MMMDRETREKKLQLRIDLHCHLVPGVDDGCQTIEESLDCVRAWGAAGYLGSVCTPHMGSDWFPDNTPRRIAPLVGELQHRLDQEGLDYRLWSAGEVRLSETVVSWLREFGVPTLGETRWVLVDYFGRRWPECCDAGINYLLDRGYEVLLAHPERLTVPEREWQAVMDSLSERGVRFQGNLNSISGGEGPLAQDRALRWLSDDRYFVLASDTHGPDSVPGRLLGLKSGRTRNRPRALGRVAFDTASRNVGAHALTCLGQFMRTQPMRLDHKSLRRRSPLSRDFYNRDPITVAKELLGKLIVRDSPEGLAGGRIVEVEAYLGGVDSASHSYKGKSNRNAVMFGPPGFLYVYAIHSRWCMNAVTEEEEKPTAVLIRAVEPLWGIDLMQRRRGRERLTDLTTGPARLCESLAVDRRLNGWDLTVGREIWIAEDPKAPPETPPLLNTIRIGVTSAKEELLRFCYAGNPYVSGPRRLRVANSELRIGSRE